MVNSISTALLSLSTNVFTITILHQAASLGWSNQQGEPVGDKHISRFFKTRTSQKDDKNS